MAVLGYLQNRETMGKKLTRTGFTEVLMRIKQAGLEKSPPPNRKDFEVEALDSIEKRVAQLFNIVERDQTVGNMVYFVMYDIEDNKVRVQVSKYLVKRGCQRIQKSIFLANTDRKVFDEILDDLRAVQQCYDNNDSILLIPVSTDEIKAMRVIGQNIDVDITLRNRNTLFF